MNKKIVFLILLGIIALPMMASAVADPETISANVEKLVLVIGTTLVVIGWVIAGILYLTAMGAPDKLGTAKKALMAAIIGTILVIIAKMGYPLIVTFMTAITG